MSGFRADRESVALLRASARALIDETISEPCWGLAHGLAELIEGLVSSSGKPAEYFGKGGGHVYGPEDVEFMPECCPACGEWAGQHESWCSHAHEGQAEPAEGERPLHEFGCCPVCHQAGLLTFIGPDDWFVCREHMIAWCAGSGLFSAWQELTQEQHEANRALIERCERLGQPVCTCSSERSPFESEQPEWLTRGPAEPAGTFGGLVDRQVYRLGDQLLEFCLEGDEPNLYKLSGSGEYYHAEGETCYYTYENGSWHACICTEYEEGRWAFNGSVPVRLSISELEPVATSRQALSEPAEDAAAGELLAWLDLSGLPPVPPPEPPARKPTNWRFDGPEGIEQIPLLGLS